MIKRLFDIVVSAIGNLVISPIVVVLSVQVRCKRGSQVLFRQVLPGKGSKPFEKIRFRTVRVAVEDAGNSLLNTQRMPPFDNFLRSINLAELHEFWNVIKRGVLGRSKFFYDGVFAAVIFRVTSMGLSEFGYLLLS